MSIISTFLKVKFKVGDFGRDSYKNLVQAWPVLVPIDCKYRVCLVGHSEPHTLAKHYVHIYPSNQFY